MDSLKLGVFFRLNAVIVNISRCADPHVWSQMLLTLQLPPSSPYGHELWQESGFVGHRITEVQSNLTDQGNNQQKTKLIRERVIINANPVFLGLEIEIYARRRFNG